MSKQPSVLDAFYENPSPARACALASADHRAARGVVSWQFIEHLNTAEKICEAADDFSRDLLHLECELSSLLTPRQKQMFIALYRKARGMAS